MTHTASNQAYATRSSHDPSQSSPPGAIADLVHISEFCCRCQKTLSDPVSMATGYGPDCRRILGITSAEQESALAQARTQARQTHAQRVEEQRAQRRHRLRQRQLADARPRRIPSAALGKTARLALQHLRHELGGSVSKHDTLAVEVLTQAWETACETIGQRALVGPPPTTAGELATLAEIQRP